MAKKPNVQIGSVGPAGQGRGALTAAIVTVLARECPGSDMPKDGWGIADRDYVEYETEDRHYCHVSFGTDQHRFMTGLINGANQVDGLVLVVSVPDGASTVNRQNLRFARELGVSSVVVFLNKVDLVDDDEVIRQAEVDVRLLLTECGYAGLDVPVVAGSALKALEGNQSEIGEPAIRRLLEAFDNPTRPHNAASTPV